MLQEPHRKPGKQVGEIAVVSNLTASPVTDDATGSVTKSCISVVPVSVRKGDHEPKFVMCYVNPVTPPTSRTPSITSKLYPSGGYHRTGDNMRFPMSNSVYYDKDGNLVRATEIERVSCSPPRLMPRPRLKRTAALPECKSLLSVMPPK